MPHETRYTPISIATTLSTVSKSDGIDNIQTTTSKDYQPIIREEIKELGPSK
jgi:hypothetical protein